MGKKGKRRDTDSSLSLSPTTVANDRKVPEKLPVLQPDATVVKPVSNRAVSAFADWTMHRKRGKRPVAFTALRMIG
jgi:hypothetical protein